MTISATTVAPTTLAYFAPPPDGSKPYTYVNVDAETGERKQNWIRELHHNVPVENLRGKEHTVSLDKTGFQYGRAPQTYTAFTDDAEIEREYYPESIALVKKLTGASRIVPFDHTIRRHRPGETEDTPQKRQPVLMVHVDQTTESSIARVKRHLPETEANELLKHRFQIVNLWRPINQPAWDWPLALCDYGTVDPDDFVPSRLVYPDREGETLNVKYNPNHKWKYLKGMEPDEFVLIKCYDSKDDGKTAVFTPHTAFDDVTKPEGAPLRESIELRLLIFYDE